MFSKFLFLLCLFIPATTTSSTLRYCDFPLPAPSEEDTLCKPKTNLLYELVFSDIITSFYGLRVHPVTGRFGFHHGIDIAAPYKAKVRPFTSGVVEEVSRHKYYGLNIVIDHGKTMKTRYAHLQETLVYPGQLVDRKTIIGKVGTSGRATGPHLHFELRFVGENLNPLKANQIYGIISSENKNE